MPLRLLRLYHSSSELEDIFKDLPIIDIIEERRGKRRITDMILLAENTDMVIEKIEKHLSKQKYRMLIIPVEATVPRMEEEKEKEEEKKRGGA